jgi:hypothetical protein
MEATVGVAKNDNFTVLLVPINSLRQWLGTKLDATLPTAASLVIGAKEILFQFFVHRISWLQTELSLDIEPKSRYLTLITAHTQRQQSGM